MSRIFGLSLVMALIWMALSNQINLAGFVLGYVVGFAILYGVWGRSKGRHGIRFAPSLFLYSLLFLGYLLLDILLSGTDVARRVLRRKMPINPGIVRYRLPEEVQDSLFIGIAADAITITPGELVVDFDPEDSNTLFIHSLDVEQTRATIEEAQARRSRYIHRLLGY
jgi:multicomponent Na+:H+ antiporter subunit E